MSDPKQDPLGIVGQTIDERYLVRELVDEGGFGYVYKATRLLWENPVAVKFFKTGGDAKRQQTLKEAFIREGAVLSELSRKTTSIVQSRDVGTATLPDGQQVLYTVLEWLEGKNLGKLLAEERRSKPDPSFSPKRIVDVLGPIVHALEVAHASGVAHRDLKPTNIFLVEEEAGVVTPKLLDFGVAKVVGDLADGFNQTATKTASYTPAYGAPEQFSRSHGPTGPWTDVYSLAIVAMELLLGRYPLRAETLIQVVSVACDPEVRPTPSNCGAAVSPELEQVFLKALALRTEDRYQSVGEFWQALMQAPPFSDMPIGEATTVRGEPSPWSFGRPTLRMGPTGEAASALATHTTTPQVAGAAPTRESRRSVGERALLGITLVLVVALGALLWATQRARPSPPATLPAPAPKPVRQPKSRIDPERLASFTALPPVVTAPHNPLTPEKIELGRVLFFDKRLSRAGDVACVSCHDLERYGVDNQRVSTGHMGQLGTRNSPSVYNVAGGFALMWDGSAPNLEEQAKMPLLNPKEMAITEGDVVKTLSQVPGYLPLFAKAFPGEARPLSFQNIALAIGAFERRLMTPARWDKFLAGEHAALSDEEKAGFNEFADVGCLTCHYGAYIGLTSYQKLGLLRAWPDTKDRGRFEVTEREEDWMMFRVPSLRNVEKTAPYFHDGSSSSLENAVTLMGRHQLGKELEPAQVMRIVAWLKSLTGEIPSEYVKMPALP